jgi:hypothetical protein
MTFRKFETPVTSGLLKNSRLAWFIAFFGGGDHDLRPVQPAPMPVKLASTRPSHERMQMTPQKLPNNHRDLRGEESFDRSFAFRAILRPQVLLSGAWGVAISLDARPGFA